MSKKDKLPLLPVNHSWSVSITGDTIYVALYRQFDENAAARATHTMDPNHLKDDSYYDQCVIDLANAVFNKFQRDQYLQKWAKTWQ